MGLRPTYQTIDHTGDIGIIVRAATLPALFEAAALALFDILVDPDTVRAESPQPVEVSGEGREELMVRWLAELLFLFDARRVVFGRFEVEEIHPDLLRARAWGEPFDEDRHVVRTELKAVTYHGLLVSEDRDGWSARIIFDV
jgi:SHS2 domain-containing protein